MEGVSISAEPSVLSSSTPKAYRAVFFGGLIAGTLDITAACIQSSLHGPGPVRMLQGIASGLIGQNAFSGGAATAALGLALHFFIATTACAVFFLASRKLVFMISAAVVCGPVYGVLVYAFMYFVVLPLTFPHRIRYTLVSVCTGLIVHMVCIGLPISLTVRRYSK